MLMSLTLSLSYSFQNGQAMKHTHNIGTRSGIFAPNYIIMTFDTLYNNINSENKENFKIPEFLH